MCELSCREKLCVQRLSEKRHSLRSLEKYLDTARRSLEKTAFQKGGNMGITDPVFNILIAVEVIKRYIDAHLNLELGRHDMTNVKGTNRYRVHCHHCHCED